MMSKAIQIQGFGGPEALQLVEVAVGDPGPGEIRIRHVACGLNFIDVYQRTGQYNGKLPLTLGMEAAGVIEAVGEGVSHLAQDLSRLFRGEHTAFVQPLREVVATDVRHHEEDE